MTIFYHTTDSADAILRDGFRDAEGDYGLAEFALRGVFIANTPLDWQEGATGDQLLEIVLPDDLDLGDFELVEECKSYREWCIPADLINSRATMRLLTEEEADRARYGD